MLWILPAARVLAAGDCIWVVGNACINLAVEVDGASLVVKDGSTSAEWALSKTYQGEDTIGVTITASYDGTQGFSLTGASYAVSAFQGPAALLPPFTVAGNSIDFKVDISSLDGLDAATPYLPLVLSLNFSVEDAPPVTKGVRLVFYPKQIVDVSYIAPDAKARVSVSEVDLTPDDAPALQVYGNVSWARIPVANALVTPRSKEKKFLFVPESQATASSGVPGIAVFDVVANTVAAAAFPEFSAGAAAAQNAASEDPAKLEDTIQVAVSSNGKEGVKEGGVISRYYAVVDYVENGVSAKGALGGDYVPVNVGDRLGPGTTLMLVFTRDPFNRLLKPYIKLSFYDNSNGKAELLNEFENDPSKALYIKLGEEGVSGVAPCDIVTDATTFMQDVAENPIDYARIVITHGFGKAVSAFTGGAGWVVSKTLGAGTRWLIKKYAGPTGSADQMRSFSTASGPVTMRMGQGSAYRFESIVRNQEIALYNRGADVLLSDSYSTSVIPERSSVSFKPSGAVSSPTAIFPSSAIPAIPVVLSPVHGGAVDSLYSCLQASFSGFSLPGPPEPINSSFRARLNGRLVSPFMRVDGQLQRAVYCPPEDAPLKEGENIFRAAISTANSGRRLAESRFTASAAVPAAPGGLRSAAGADYIILLWNRSRENYVAKYQVYHADSPTGAPVLLGDAAEPVYAIPASYAGRYYSIRACDTRDRCSAESPRLQANLNPSYVPAIPVISGISSQLQEDAIVISVAAGSPAPLAWRLQKAGAADGPFTDVAVGGLIIGDSYTVRGTNQGVDYWFRAVPVGGNLVEGAALTIGPLRLTDLAPPKPDGLSVEFEQGAARVEWNPSAAKDLAGYYLYRSIDDGAYVRIAGGAPITNSYYNDWVESDHRISWKVAAVDMQNNLSAVSDPVYASSWGLGYPGVLPCSITVDSNPDGLNASWTLTGPNAFSNAFNGDVVVGNLAPGTYNLAWADYSGWDKPADREVTLAAGESVTITGTYRLTPVIPTPPTEGAVGSNITINGLNFGSAQGVGYVDFNGTRGTIVSWSDTQIIVKVPHGATSGCLKIVTDYGESGCIEFIVSRVKKSLPFLMLLLNN